MGRGAVHQLVRGQGRAGGQSGARVGLGDEFILSEFFTYIKFLIKFLFCVGASGSPLVVNFFPFLGYLEYA